jgi:hypothetical protein
MTFPRIVIPLYLFVGACPFHPPPFPPPTQPGLARVAQYNAQVGQARLAAGEARVGVFAGHALAAHHRTPRGASNPPEAG